MAHYKLGETQALEVSPRDVASTSSFVKISALAWLAACGGTPQGAGITPPRAAAPVIDAAPAPPPVDEEPAPALRISIDWATTPLATDADANAVWAKIAPTGDDWELKLGEVPVAYARPLAIAMLHGGNFACPVPPAPAGCPREVEVPDPAPTAGLDDPCLRRLLALWATSQLVDDVDIATVMDSLRAIAALPPPESQLVAAAIDAIGEDDHDRRLELIAIAQRAGNRDVAGSKLGKLDEAHLIEAVQKHHVSAGLEVLSAQGHRAVYLSAINDEALDPRARATAIGELVEAEPALPPDLTKALATATKAKDCLVAATASRALVTHGDQRYLPRRPRGRSAGAMMRALCVLASYEQLQLADESDESPSLLPGYVPAKGLEIVTNRFTTESGWGDDNDGDGDPRTRNEFLMPRAQVSFYEVEDFVRAFRSCKGTTCTSSDRQYELGLKTIGGQSYLARITITELPSCPIP